MPTLYPKIFSPAKPDDGIFSKGLKTTGASLVNAKITLFNNYIANAYGTVDNFTHWNNLMGDPALHLWTGPPSDFSPQYNSDVPDGINYLDILILENLETILNLVP